MNSQLARPQEPDYSQIACVCATFIKTLFVNTDGAPRTNVVPPGRAYWIQPTAPTVPLPQFIQSVLHRTLMPSSVVFAALMLLQRLKAMHPSAGAAPRSSYGLFLVSYMLATKTHSDASYANVDWVRASGHMFQLRGLNGMERELLTHLHWKVNVDADEASLFQRAVMRDYSGQQKPKVYTKNEWPSNTDLRSMPPNSSDITPIPSGSSHQMRYGVQPAVVTSVPHSPSTVALMPTPTVDYGGPYGLPVPNHYVTIPYATLSHSTSLSSGTIENGGFQSSSRSFFGMPK